jgi:hypothetical protein
MSQKDWDGVMRKSLPLLIFVMIGAIISARAVDAQDNPFRRAFEGVKRLILPEPLAPPANMAFEQIADAIAGEALGLPEAVPFELPVRQAWSPSQVTGPPNTPGAGDIQTAWASATQDGQDEWLELTYEKAIVPKRVVIHETFNPGAVSRITVYPDKEGDAADEQEVWEGNDPTAVGEQRGISRIDVKTDIMTKRIRIYIDSKRVAGWNEIDAVGIVDEIGALQWAKRAAASSTFGEGGGDFVGGGGGIAVGQQVFAGQVLGGLDDMVAIGPGAQVLGGRANRDADFDRLLKDQELQMAKLLRQLKESRSNAKKLEDSLNEKSQRLKKLEAELKALKEK